MDHKIVEGLNVTNSTQILLPKAFQISIISFWILSLLGATFGGALTLLAICHKFYPKIPANEVMVINFVVADCLFAMSSIAYMLPLALDIIPKPIFLFNSFTCRLQYMIILYFYFASTLILIVLSIIRYVKIVKSFAFKRYFSKRNMVIIVCFVWLTPLLLVLPPLIGFWGKLIYRRSYGGICVLDLEPPITADRLTYNVIVIGMLHFTAANVIISWCYYKIYNTIRRSANRIRGFTLSDHSSTAQNAKIYLPFRQKNETKIAATLFLIYIAFFISYWPIAISSALSLLGLARQSLMELLLFVTIMYSNGIFNPWIILYGQRYRKYLNNIFRSSPVNTSVDR